jgi:hypothetical protein
VPTSRQIQWQRWDERLHALEVLSGRFVDVSRLGDAVVIALTATTIDPLRESARRSFRAV